MFAWDSVQWNDDGKMLMLMPRGEGPPGSEAGRVRRGRERLRIIGRWQQEHGMLKGGRIGFTDGAASEEEAHPAQGAHRGGAEEAEVSHGDEPFGEHVEEPAADEFPRLDRFALPLCIGTIFVPQQNAAAFIVAGEAALVEGGLGDVGCEIAHGAAAASSGSAIGHPFLLPKQRDRFADAVRGTAKQTLGKQMADASGERQDVDEELFVGRVSELTALVAQRDRRDEDVDVRMVAAFAGSRFAALR